MFGHNVLRSALFGLCFACCLPSVFPFLMPPALLRTGSRLRCTSTANRRIPCRPLILKADPSDSTEKKNEEIKRIDLEAESKDEEPSPLEESIVKFGRRTLLGTVGLASIIGYVNIYGDNELNEFDSFLRRTFPDRYKKTRVRKQLQPSFVAALADVYEYVAVSDLKLLSADKLRADEALLAAKASSFFPGLSVPTPGAAGLPLSSLLSSEAGCNLALYARLHTIAAYLPSPKSRKDFGKRVAARILTSSLVSDFFKLSDYTVRDPIADFRVWAEGSRALIGAYTSAGFGVLTIGEKGIGELREEDWVEDRRASFSLFVGDLAVLAGEALDDLALTLLPALPLVAFWQRCGIQADAESYYMSSQYTRNPADYRPDGAAIQFNLECTPGAPAPQAAGSTRAKSEAAAQGG